MEVEREAQRDTDERAEILRRVHQAQQEESRQHRTSIQTGFALFLTGLMAVLGGIVAAERLSVPEKLLVGTAVIVVSATAVRFMRRQRAESEKAMKIVRAIENHFRLYDTGVYLPSVSVLPQDFADPTPVRWGLSRGDRIEAWALIGVALLALILLWHVPNP